MATVAACQPLPQPFVPTDKTANPLLAPGLRTGDASDGITGIHVRPVAGVPKPADGAMARAMAKALRDLDIAAGTRALNSESLILEGLAEQVARDDGGESGRESGRLDIRISWRLTDSRGRIVGRHLQQKSVGRKAWLGAEELGAEEPPAAKLAAELTHMARDAALKIARFIGDATTAMARSRPAIALAPVDGAPGDGAKSLTRAMGLELARAGIRISADEDDTDDRGLVLLGDVHIGGTGQRVDITWTLIRSDGSRIGTVAQGSAIKAGSLDGAWGATATAIARDAAKGVVDLLDRMAAKNLAQRR